MGRTILIGLAALFLSASVSAQTLEGIDQLVTPHIGADTPGMAVLVTGQGAVLHLAGYGFADLDSQTPITPESVFDLASTSKQFTALAAQLLIADGAMTLSTPVADILPVFEDHQSGTRPLLVSDLVYHLSGLPDYLDESLFDYQADTSNDQIVAWLAAAPPAHAPGTTFDYSNSGYVTLGSLVAAADDQQSLEDVLNQRVWRPLGMQNTRLGAPVDPALAVTGYAGLDGAFEPSSFMTLAQGDGSVYSAVADLLLFERALVEGTLLDAPATAQLFADGRFDNGDAISAQEDEGYGFGWNVPGDGTAYHSGSWMGTATVYLRDLDSGVSVIILANGEDFDPVDLAFEIADAVDF